MTSSPIVNPEIPYVGPVDDCLVPGKMLKVQGKTPSDAVRFAINYQLGPTLNPRDDIAVHLSPRFPEGFITRNHIQAMRWGIEENDGPMWIQPGEEFEIIILCDPNCYKIAVNGKHFTEFAHRLPYQKVTHLVIDGDVNINSISYEMVPVDSAPRSPRAAPVPDVPPASFGPPPPGGLYPTLDPQGPPPPAAQGGYGPPPPHYGGPNTYDPSRPYGPNVYDPSRPYGYQPGYQKAEEEDAFGGCLDKVGMALGGLVAAGGVAAAMHALNKKKPEEKDHEKTDASKTNSESEGGLGNLGALGAALATSIASNALQGRNAQAQQGYPPQESGGVLGSILGALGGAGGGQQSHYPPQQPAGNADPFSGALGSIFGGVLGGGGNQQQQQQQPAYQPSGGYGGHQPSGGYPPQQNSSGNDFLSGIGSAIGSSLLNSAIDGLTKHGKDKSRGENQPAYQPPSNNTTQYNPPPVQPTTRADSPPAPGGGKLSAAEISKGLGLSDDED